MRTANWPIKGTHISRNRRQYTWNHLFVRLDGVFDSPSIFSAGRLWSCGDRFRRVPTRCRHARYNRTHDVSSECSVDLTTSSSCTAYFAGRQSCDTRSLEGGRKDPPRTKTSAVSLNLSPSYGLYRAARRSRGVASVGRRTGAGDVAKRFGGERAAGAHGGFDEGASQRITGPVIRRAVSIAKPTTRGGAYASEAHPFACALPSAGREGGEGAGMVTGT
jgi:hypothetical protein